MLGLIASLALQDAPPRWDPKVYPWPMWAQNPRRTGQSPHAGPRKIGRHWTYVATGGCAINFQPVLASEGVYFGTWGLLRREEKQTPDQWDKMDGKYYGLSPKDGRPLFEPLRPAHVPVGYKHPGRARLPRDRQWTGAQGEWLVSFYNGTIEGVTCIDPDDGTHYVGRGDGALFAIDPRAGKVKWVFRTFNPMDPADHDGGGEIIGGPVLGPKKIIYFGTVGMPFPDEAGYETNAVYAVDSSGKLVWRFPSKEARLDNWVYTPPALSPDGRTLYFATYGGDLAICGKLYALDLQAPEDKRMKWVMELRNEARPLKPNIHVRWIAVGPDGRVFCGGHALHFGGSAPVVFAVEDRGSSGAYAWNPAVVEPQGWPSKKGRTAGGLAIAESDGKARTLFFTTAFVGRVNGDGGALFALDPATGGILAEFEPGGPGGLTAPTLGSDGVVYFGLRGRSPPGPAADGRVYAVELTDKFKTLWEQAVEGQIDWSAPTIGHGALYLGTAAPFGLAQALFHKPSEVPRDTSPRFYGLFE
jgi:outer membrane protein assembly factor BamB